VPYSVLGGRVLFLIENLVTKHNKVATRFTQSGHSIRFKVVNQLISRLFKNL
jgi:hypothetical protein